MKIGLITIDTNKPLTEEQKRELAEILKALQKLIETNT